MAKGKQSLKETLSPEKIIKTDEEVGSIPFWLINDTYGVAVDAYEYSLVEKKEMTRSVKDDSGQIIGGEIYYSWTYCKSASSFEDALLVYSQVTERKLMGKLVKSKDFRELVKIRLQIQKTINNSFKIEGLNQNVLNACNTIESHKDLEVKINEVSKLIELTTTKANDFIDFIKEKHTIIVQRTESKKHRTPKEDE